MDWKSYWEMFPKKFDRADLLRQAQYTVNGKPLEDAHIFAFVQKIINSLNLGASDKVLDLCCGNGLVTCQLARHCHSITGVDYSRTLIDIARDISPGPNVTYMHCDAISYLSSSPDAAFDKIVMNGAMQYFSKSDGTRLILLASRVLKPRGTMIITGIPDARRKFVFYNTFARRIRYLWKMMTGREQIGVWWQQDAIRSAAAGVGLHCYIQSHGGPAGYRFDSTLTHP